MEYNNIQQVTSLIYDFFFNNADNGVTEKCQWYILPLTLEQYYILAIV